MSVDAEIARAWTEVTGQAVRQEEGEGFNSQGEKTEIWLFQNDDAVEERVPDPSTPAGAWKWNIAAALKGIRKSMQFTNEQKWIAHFGGKIGRQDDGLHRDHGCSGAMDSWEEAYPEAIKDWLRAKD